MEQGQLLNFPGHDFSLNPLNIHDTLVNKSSNEVALHPTPRWVDVSMGGIHAIGLRENSGLYLWGSSDGSRGARLRTVGMGFVPISQLELF